ncbi:MAG: ATP-binding cassette domain-containing protein, partial [Chloroflexota bacterium]
AGVVAPSLGGGRAFGLDLTRGRVQLRPVIGFLAGETYLYDDLTALENLRFTATMAGRPTSSADLERALLSVDLAGHENDRVRSFSSGMQRRLSVARTLLLNPRLLLLDEPYNSLDAAGADLIDSTVQELVQQGGSTVLATHDTDRALALADLVAVLHRGSLAYFGSVAGYRMREVLHVG